jgi:hypothetical protein
LILSVLQEALLTSVFRVDRWSAPTLRKRHRDAYDRLVAQWKEWNATMLPLDPQSFTFGFTGEQLADHFGVKAGA